MKRSFLVVSHGYMGIETIHSAELLMGPQHNVSALTLRQGDSIDNLEKKVISILTKNDEKYDETIVLVDLLGGSPSNVAMRSIAKFRNLKIITGLNLPLLINLINFQNVENTEDLIEESIKLAKDGIKLIDKNFFS